VKVENSCEKSDFFDILEDLAGNTPEVTFLVIIWVFLVIPGQIWRFGGIFDISEDLAGIAPEVTFWSLFGHFLGFFGLPANILRFLTNSLRV